jgi:hypothetical protein
MKKIIKTSLIVTFNILFVSLLILGPVQTVYSQTGGGGSGTGGGGSGTGGGGSGTGGGGKPYQLSNPLKGANTITEFVALVFTKIVMPVAAVIAALAIIYSGFLMVMARGNEKELETAKRAFFYSVIGTAIVLGAWGIAVAIQNTINSITGGATI